MDNKHMVKPFLKWLGGKTQLLSRIEPLVPKKIRNYHEIFVGGGSILLMVLALAKESKITISGTVYAYDINRALIATYKNVQKYPEKLCACVEMLASEYAEEKEKKEYYYMVRENYNICDKDTVEACAMFIFLNKTCFRGIHREGPHGFNVPYGNYTNVEILDRKNILEVSALIKNVKFIRLDCEDVLRQKFDHMDFVYLDPPYVPLKATSFVSYNASNASNANTFDSAKHARVFALVKTLPRFLMSNAKCQTVVDAFKEFDIQTVDCRRSINSKNPADTAKEVLVRSNYVIL